MGQTVSPPAPSPAQMAGTEMATTASISAKTKTIDPKLKGFAKAVEVILLR